MSATKVFKIVERIEKLRANKILSDEKHQKALAYYDDQYQKTKEKFEKEMKYWYEARTKSVISNLKNEMEVRNKHILLLQELDLATSDAKSVTSLKEVIERVKGYSYKDNTQAIELLKE